jgi:aminoglycoside phosphotransferase (APT) family kinase protein
MAGPVRHPIDLARLEAYINAHVPSIATPLSIAQFGYGQSNPTYQLTSLPTSQRYVLRKKPPGKLISSTAHKVEREHRIIAALGSSPYPVPVPKAYVLCEDPNIIGTPFYVMSFLDGRIIQDPAMPGLPASERRALWSEAVRTLALLHSVDPDGVGLGNFGRRSGFYNRQVRTWSTICAAQAATKDVDTGEPVGALPHFEEMMRFFADERRQPADRGTLIHGDYKIDNLVFHKTEPRVIGILEYVSSSPSSHTLIISFSCIRL